jgi:hypothetical protein
LAPTVGIATTGFCNSGGILQLFHREDQQIFRLPTAAVRSIQQNLSSTSAIVCIVKIFTASPSRIGNFVQSNGSRHNSKKSIYRLSPTMSSNLIRRTKFQEAAPQKSRQEGVRQICLHRQPEKAKRIMKGTSNSAD